MVDDSVLKNKLPFVCKFYLTNIMTNDERQFIKNLFKRKVKCKKEKLNDEYLRVNIYSKSINVIDKNSLYEEFLEIKDNEEDYFSNISKELRKYLTNAIQKKYDFDFYNYKQNYNSQVEKRIQYLENFGYIYFYDEWFENGELKANILNQYGFNDDKLFKPLKNVFIDLIDFILIEDKVDFLNDDYSVKNNLIDYYVIQQNELPYTTFEKNKISTKRTYRMFKDLAMLNCDKFKYFCTFTFANKENEEKYLKLNENREKDDIDLKFKFIDDSTNYDFVIPKMTYFLNKTKKYFKRKGYEFYYLGVCEYQHNGNIHFHFLFSDVPNEYIFKNPSWLDYDFINKKKNNSYGFKLWEYGKSDIQLIKNNHSLTTYISKYMLKNLKELKDSVYQDRLNKKRYYSSNNLDSVIESKYYDEYTSSIDSNVDYESKYIQKRCFEDFSIETKLYTLNKTNNSEVLINNV